MGMKLIIAGSRYLTANDYPVIEAEIIKHFNHLDVDEIVSGGAKGADTLGERFAREYGLRLTRFVAEWDIYGKRAGPRRNLEMAEYANALICFPKDDSIGSRHMIRTARIFELDPVVTIEMGTVH